MFDLAELDTTAACDEGAEIELLHPITKEKLGMFVKVLGRDSTVFREHIARSANADRQKQFQAQRRGKTIEPKTFEESEADGIELLVICTIGFRNVTYKGALLTFNADNARKLYKEQIWVRRQVDEAIAELENFMPS